MYVLHADKSLWKIVFLSFIACVTAFLASFPLQASSQGSGSAITGYAWSDTIGWIDLSCKNASGAGCTTWGLYVTTGGAMSGYAWSDNVGWISANSADLSGCPSGTCSATMSTSGLSGWLRVIEGGTAGSGDWDGFISLSGSGYGVQYSSGTFLPCSNGTSCAWGDKNLGWVDFSNANATFGTCVASTAYTCSGADGGGVYRTLVTTVTDTSCEQEVTNYNCLSEASYRYCSTGSPTCLTPQITAQSSGSLTGHLALKPNLVAKNATTTVYWNMTNVDSCTVTGTDGTSWTGASAAASNCSTKYGSGCTSLAITKQTFYTLSCTGLDSTSYTENASVNIIPDFEER